MSKNYKWVGASGYTPLIGAVSQGQELILNLNEQEIEKLIAQKLIEEVKTTSKTSKIKG